jgi:hypothetical protein
MMAILTLYMDEVLRFDAARIGRVYGGYIGGVYRSRSPAACRRTACSAFTARSSPVACS